MNNLMVFENIPVEVFELNGQAFLIHMTWDLDINDVTVRRHMQDINFRKLHNCL